MNTTKEMNMKHHYTSKNPELTTKALQFISKNGRNEFDKMINNLLDKKISPINEGWIKKRKTIKKRKNK